MRSRKHYQLPAALATTAIGLVGVASFERPIGLWPSLALAGGGLVAVAFNGWRSASRLTRAREAMEKGERMRLLGQVSGGLAHQLRNAVAGAKLAAARADRERPGPVPRPRPGQRAATPVQRHRTGGRGRHAPSAALPTR
jgi:hypothetical protein